MVDENCSINNSRLQWFKEAYFGLFNHYLFSDKDQSSENKGITGGKINECYLYLM